MAWIVGIAVACLFIWLLVVAPGFRKFALIALLLIGAAIGYYFYDQSEKERRTAELMRPADVELSQLTMEANYGSSYMMQGTVRNRSNAYTLGGFTVQVKAHDCPTEAIAQDCDVIGDETVSVFIDVPPDQVRGFDKYVSFPNMPNARHLVWSYTLQSVRAKGDLTTQ